MKLLTGLYEHQKKAVKKLNKIKVGALYMEMGTGKTRTALELVKKRFDKNKIDHVLWLCPCSIKESLKRDIEKHITGLNYSKLTICGIETLSSSVKTNSELLRLVQEKRVYLIVDESNLVKNYMAKRTKNIIRLSEHCTYKLILNGTPISRNEEDLFSQWYILDYRILGYQSFWSFAANHLEYDERIPNKVNNTLNTGYLVKKIAPYTYQARKDECLDLPEKIYDTEYYKLTNEQEIHYDEIFNKLLGEVEEIEPHTIYRLFTGAQNVISGFRVNTELSLTKTLFFKNPLENPRIDKLLEIINKIEDKIIIFCKYTQEIKDIVSVLNDKYGDGAALPFYGEVKQKERQLNIDKFSKDSRFLVANKVCAGYGLNLQFCKNVIYYSNDWDYATRSQSEDRVHRIGQQDNVHIIDICASYTLDERILKCLNRKESLVDSFKYEIEQQKDKKYLELWLNGRTMDGRNYSNKVKVDEYEDLKEG